MCVRVCVLCGIFLVPEILVSGVLFDCRVPSRASLFIRPNWAEVDFALTIPNRTVMPAADAQPAESDDHTRL